MNIKSSYETLYQHWFKEYNQKEITALNQQLYEEYTRLITEIMHIENDSKRTLQFKLLSSYQEHFNYLFGDLLKMREVKLLNAALNLREISISNLYEAEKLFYQNLISTLKGFEKIKKMSGSELITAISPLVEEKTQQENIFLEKEGMVTEDDSTSKEAVPIEEPPFSEGEDGKLTLIRFIKECPPLVGVDLKDYGPFEKEDVAYLPDKNAQILIYEKIAETIELS